MCSRRVVQVATGLALFLGAAADAQSVPVRGARVRVAVAQGPTYRGTYLRLAGDSLELALDDPSSRVRIPLESVRRIEIRRGRGTGAGKGALIGGGLGVAAGVAFALSSPRGDLSRTQFVMIAGMGSGVLGGALGFFFGSFTTIEKWGPGTLPIARAQPHPSDWRLGVRVRWRR